MKRLFSALSVIALVLGPLAMQSCESTDGQHSYYNRDHSGYYRGGRYADDNDYYRDGSYVGDNGYYRERRYVHDDYQSESPCDRRAFLEQIPLIVVP
jgi:hypothetical protein